MNQQNVPNGKLSHKISPQIKEEKVFRSQAQPKEEEKKDGMPVKQEATQDVEMTEDMGANIKSTQKQKNPSDAITLDIFEDKKVSATSKPKKLFGLRKTASMMSNFFGAEIAKKKVKAQLRKRYEELEKHVLDPQTQNTPDD